VSYKHTDTRTHTGNTCLKSQRKNGKAKPERNNLPLAGPTNKKASWPKAKQTGPKTNWTSRPACEAEKGNKSGGKSGKNLVGSL